MTSLVFNVLAAQPEYGPALRRLICELAVAGRLLPRAGDWAEHRLSKIVSVRGGSTPSMARPEYWGGDVPWVSPKDMHAGEIVTSEMFITQEALAKSNLELVPLGSVLIVGRSGILKRKLPAQVTRVPCTVNQDIKALTPTHAIESAYLRLWLLGSEREILAEDVKTGTTVQSLVFPKLFARRVLLPPLAEQHRIVAKVDELMALCDRLEARQQDAEAAHARLVQALLDSLTQARDADAFQACWQRVAESFSTLFTTDGAIAALRRAILRCGVSGRLTQRLSSDKSARDLLSEASVARARLASAGRAWSLEDVVQASPTDLAFEIPETWAVVRTAEVCWPITSGSTPPASDMNESMGIPFLKVYNIRSQAIDFGYKPQFVSESYHDSKLRRSCLRPGDIVMNIVGPPLGKIAVVPDDFPEWNCNQAIVGFRLIPPMVPEFFYLYLCEGTFLQGIELIGTAGQDNISVKKSKHLPVPVPPMEEQHRIVAKVTELLALCDQLKARIAAARAKHAQLAEALVAQAVAA
jgi:type I restriction enzyme S subunit